jgi:hypothetical protein
VEMLASGFNLRWWWLIRANLTRGNWIRSFKKDFNSHAISSSKLRYWISACWTAIFIPNLVRLVWGRRPVDACQSPFRWKWRCHDVRTYGTIRANICFRVWLCVENGWKLNLATSLWNYRSNVEVTVALSYLWLPEIRLPAHLYWNVHLRDVQKKVLCSIAKTEILILGLTELKKKTLILEFIFRIVDM